jgi:hypothetical protein
METTSTLPVVVESGGDEVVGHAGLHTLGDLPALSMLDARF